MSLLRFARLGGAALAAATAILSALPGVAAPVRTERVTAELLADRSAAVPGQPVTVGLRLVMDKGWHTYWRNPGDSGLPTRIAWTLPEGWSAGPIQWPYPEAQRVGPLMNYGYSNDVVLLSTITPSANAAPGPVTLTAKADWLVCEDICIPEKATLRLALPVASSASEAKPANASLFDKARANLPVDAKGWRAESSIAGNLLTLRLVPPPEVMAPATVTFFPFRENFVDHPAEQRLVRDGNGIRLTIKLVEPLAPDISEATGLLVAGSAWPGLGQARAINITAPVTTSLPPAAESTGSALGSSLVLALVFALAGGMLLNLMPCVFPVLGIKVMGFVQHAHGNTRALRLQGVVFTVGVLVSFIALAALLLTLRAGGAQLGWGFQLQSPAFVTALAALFLLMGLNLFGVFEWGGFAQSLTSNVSARGRYGDAFLAGVLATAVATPCTAPFMGAAVGFTLAQPPATSLAVFATLALGMALPVLLLSFFPAALKRLPKPGPWMETFKQLMAFPLLGTVVWLAWVLGAQAGNDAVLALLAGLLLLSMAAWVYGRWAQRAGLMRLAVAACLAITGIAVAWPGGSTKAPGALPSLAKAAKAGEVAWQAWTPERFAELRAAGTPVFIDFTAAWCVTCQVNKRVALNREVVAKAMADRGVVALQADWTNYDPRITAALAELGRNALPVYALYAPGEAKPRLLPEVLTASLVADEILKLPSPKVAASSPLSR